MRSPEQRPALLQTNRMERLPFERQREFLLSRLIDTVTYARSHSPFYQALYAGIPKPSDFADFQSLPVLTRESFVKAGADGSLLTAPKDAGGMVITTSGGTTGTQKYIYREPGEITSYCKTAAGYFSEYVVSPKDTIANHVGSGNLWASFIVLEELMQHTGANTLPFGTAKVETIVRGWRDHRPSVLLGIPSSVLDLLDQMESSGVSLEEFRHFRTWIHGGEHITQPQKQKLAQALGVERFVSFYSSTDTGAIAAQLCNHPSGGMHTMPDVNFVEVVNIEDIENGVAIPRVVEPGKVGAIVTTNIHYRRAPIIRFVIGDVGVLRPPTCECGIHTPILEIAGRIDDQLNISAEKWPATAALAAVVEQFGAQTTGIGQFRITKDGLKTVVRLTLESVHPQYANVPDAVEKFKLALVQSAQPYNVFAEDILSPSVVHEIRFVEPNTLERKSTGKVKLVVWE